ncbi:MAG: hypothetical protein V1900_04540 [Candidatus Aenigmatarchaeota archaeon]
MVFRRIAGFISFMLSYRRKIYLLRKRYDKVREKADRERNAEKRGSALRMLDNIEPTLVMLEEQRISRFERSRMFGYVMSGIRQAKTALKGGTYQIRKR